MTEKTSRWRRDADQMLDEIREHGLESNVAELDVLGYTVVPPERVGTPATTEQLRSAVLEVDLRRTGRKPDVVVGTSHPIQMPLPYVLFEDPIFEEALMNPVALTLTTYLVGRSCILNLANAFVKGPTTDPALHPFTLHSDSFAIPEPLPERAQYANVTWALTDYTRAGGALALVPGSHHLRRHPLESEKPLVGEHANPDAIAVEAPAGSLIVWHGNTWHGSYPRTEPGLRVTLVFAFSRMYVQTHERIREKVTSDMLDRNPPRFAVLTGQDSPYRYPDSGAEYEKIPAFSRAQASVFG